MPIKKGKLARAQAAKQKPSTKSASSNDLVNQKETRVGLAILAIVVLAIGFASARGLNGFLRDRNSQPVANTFQEQPMATVSATPSASPSGKVAANTQQLKTVTKLAYTSAEPEVIAVTVRKVDNFWKIAERTCGNGKLAEYLQRQTKHTHYAIQPGEVLYITCP